MPLYEYQCARCGSFEVIQKFADDPLAACPTCGGAVHKQPSAPAFQFKGSGWYVTDYARKGASGSTAKSGDGGDKGGGASSSTAASESSGPKSDTPATKPAS